MEKTCFITLFLVGIGSGNKDDLICLLFSGYSILPYLQHWKL